MGLNPIPILIANVFLRIVMALMFNSGEFSVDISPYDLASTIILGTIPGAPWFLSVLSFVAFTGSLIWAVAQLVRGV